MFKLVRLIAPLTVAAAVVLFAPPGSAQARTYEGQSHTAVAVSATVRSGDTAWGIAAARCGNGTLHQRLTIRSAAGALRTNHNLIWPGDRVTGYCTAGNAAPVARPSSSGSWGTPLTSLRVVSCYGQRFDPYYHVWQLHDGLDLAASYGTRVHAVHAGVVIRAGWAGGWGNMVEINHGGGVTTLYAHQSRVWVHTGQRVAKGQTVGLSGSTGASTGPHLHLRLHLNGNPANPAPFLRAHGVPVRGC